MMPSDEWLNRKPSPEWLQEFASKKAKFPQSKAKQKIKVESLEHTDNSRKKLKPLKRERTESLILIYEIIQKFKVQYLDELPAIKAWGKIISKEFISDIIKEIAINNKSITLNGNEKLSRSDFCEKYRKRFKKPQQKNGLSTVINGNNGINRR